MKIVYFGTDVFLPCFSYFVRNHQVLSLYTYHNDEDCFTEYGIVKEAEKYGIPVHYEDMTAAETKRLFTEEGCGLFFSAEYNRILPVPEEVTAFRGINLHSSLLPEGRSYYPIEAAMERGFLESGVTMHKMTAALDGGDILDQSSVEITEGMDSIDVYLRCRSEAERMVQKLMADFEPRWAAAQRQEEPKKHPYWKRPSDEKLTLTHDMTKSEAKACFRCYNQMTQVKIHGTWYYVRALDTGETNLEQDVIAVRKDQVLFGVSDGHLRLILWERKCGMPDET